MTETSSRRPVAPDTTSPPPQPTSAAPGADTRAPGFAAQFDNTSLWDLVQFECLRRTQRILRISSRGQVGFLYFRAGQIVHAATLRAVGEAAVAEMLSWRAGSVEPWNAAWPEPESITISWQSLLLGVAESTGAAGVAGGKSLTPPAPPAPPAAAPQAHGPGAAPAAVETVVLARNGRVLKGNANGGLPEAAAYAAQMADLIGEFLGLENFQTLEASFDDTHYLITRNLEGGLHAQRGSDPSRFQSAPLAGRQA